MENGRLVDWEAMEHVWDYTWKKMGIDTANSCVLLTEPPNNPEKNRKQMIAKMFEKYRFKGVHVAMQAILTLCARGVQTGIAVDSGDGVSHVIPVYESYTLPNVQRIDVAGRHVTNYLMRLLSFRGYVFNPSTDLLTVQEMKEKLCYAAYDLATEENLSRETTSVVAKYRLPDGRLVTLGSERFQATECLFQPHLLDVDQPGIPQAVYNCIEACDPDLRTPLRSHIVLSGGSTMYPGLPTRLEKDLNEMYAKSHKLNPIPPKVGIEDFPLRKHMVFIGGAVLAKILAEAQDGWITREEYDEKGPQWCLDKSLGKLPRKKP